jgi:TonB family protein
MTTSLQDDFLRGRVRTRIAMAVSIGVHVLLFLALALVKPPTPDAPLTEITWLEPGDAAAEPAGAPAPAVATPADPGTSAGAPVEERFRRAAAHAATAPVPQSDVALDDRMSARLQALQSSAAVAPVTSPVAGTPGALAGMTRAPVAGEGGSAPLALRRGGSGAEVDHPLPLARGGPGEGAALAPAIPAAGHGGEAAQSHAGEAAARRVLANAQLLGPVADRPLLHRVTPVYPEWAKRDAVEGNVTLYFIVRADGSVRENVLVQKSGGFEEFDENARVALREWRFEPLGGGRTGDQWGTITFQYRLRD